MSHIFTTVEDRDTAMRMVAATEYFKSAGELPPWARAELDSWDDTDAVSDVCLPPLLSASF